MNFISSKNALLSPVLQAVQLLCIAMVFLSSNWLSPVYGQSGSRDRAGRKPAQQGSAVRNSGGVKNSSKKKIQRLNLTIALDASKIATLKRTGKLQTRVPLANRDRIDAVEIKRGVSFKTKHFRLNDAVDRIGNLVTVRVTDEALDRLDYQPMLAKIYYSGYSTVVLEYDGSKRRKPVAGSQPTGKDSPRFFVRIDDQRGFWGWAENLANIELTTSFGKLSIDAAKVAGIKFNTNDSGQVAVRLQTGDTLSGYPNFDEITMKCSWGKQKLAVKEIESLTTDRNARFAADPLHQGRWRFESDMAGSLPSAIVPGGMSAIPASNQPANNR